MSSTTEKGTDRDRTKNKMNGNNLYREENFTDLRVGAVQRMIPTKRDGSPDESREPVFIAQTHVMSDRGPLPVQCHIEAKTLEEAVEKFQEAVDQTVERMKSEGGMPVGDMGHKLN